MEEKAIWEGIRKGDKSALKKIYDQFFSALYTYGLKITQSSADTEDAIHELFLDIWKYREGLSDTTSIRFYLYRSLRRKLYKSHTLSEKILRPDVLLDEVQEHSVETKLVEEEEKRQLSARLQEQLDTLSERQKETLLMRFYGELSYKEIAEIMEINEQSARNLVTRGLEYLRKTMKTWFLLMIFYLAN
ncbi:MAG: RNA polymerase sigma factor [Cyclobacteriaceae bacterium]|nr:RNA polymerase sigma factor [Cyclobacteriaceae bacterium]